MSGFKFEVRGAGGDAAVRITSAQPVVEPFVTLLLEVSWPQGRLLREYTVLLDPPVFATESVAAAVAAPAAQPVAAPPPAESSVIRQAAPTAQTDSGASARSAAMPVPERVPDTAPQTRAPAAPQAQPAAQQGGVYGPVKRNDTLWDIAGDMIGDSDQISRNQMMMAIYQANPEAFSGNINRLKAGMILRVPSAQTVSSLSKAAATSAVREQNTEWRAGSARAQQPSGRLKLVPPPEADSEAADPATLPAADSATASAPGARDAEAAAIGGRVQQLEAELAESRRQIQIRDQELEALQRQLAQISGAGQPADDAAAAGQEMVAEDFAAEDFTDETLGLDDGISADETESLDTTLLTDEAETPAPVDVTPAPVAEAKDESSAGGLLTNPLVYISLLVVVLLAWLVARNRSRSAGEDITGRWDTADDDTPDEVMEATRQLRTKPPVDEAFVVEEGASVSGEGDLSSPFADESADNWAGLADETETPLERTISSDSAVNLDQADPIAESDFHMAYGLYDQAADLLTKAIEDEPERKDLRMKLLEVFFIWENKDGFMRTAEALRQKFGAKGDPDWNKVLIMGKQICPNESLFADADVATGTTENVDHEFGEGGGHGDTGALDLSFGEEGAENESSLDLDFERDAAAIDLDLGGGQVGMQTRAPAPLISMSAAKTKSHRLAATILAIYPASRRRWKRRRSKPKPSKVRWRRRRSKLKPSKVRWRHRRSKPKLSKVRWRRRRSRPPRSRILSRIQ